jgi:hypothetical protein
MVDEAERGYDVNKIRPTPARRAFPDGLGRVHNGVRAP